MKTHIWYNPETNTLTSWPIGTGATFWDEQGIFQLKYSSRYATPSKYYLIGEL